MARSDEQVLRDLIVEAMMFWFRDSDGRLLHDDNCAMNIGKMREARDRCKDLFELRARLREAKLKEQQ